MKNSKLILIVFIFAVSFFFVETSPASITFPFSLTYNCPAQQEPPSPGGSWPNSGGECVGLKLSTTGGDGYGNFESVQSAANYPGGGGFLGERHWIGPGKNNHTHQIDFTFTPQKEMWIRWYIRYEDGTLINSYNVNPATGDSLPWYKKEFYLFDAAQHDFILYMEDTNTWAVVNGGNILVRSTGGGWNSLTTHKPNSNGIATADGSWHCVEWHWKMQTSGANGISELWIDNIQYMSATNLSYTYDGVGFTLGSPSNAQGMVGIPCSAPCSNGNVVNGYRAVYQDADDWAFSTTGRIGCLSSTTSPPPASPPNSPTNLRLD